jgi:hypothetical protein
MISRVPNQKSATRLSIQTVTDLMGSLLRALRRFFAKFVAIWPLTGSKRAIDVLRLQIRDLEVRNPFTVPVSQSTTAMVVAEHAELLASAKRCK